MGNCPWWAFLPPWWIRENGIPKRKLLQVCLIRSDCRPIAPKCCRTISIVRTSEIGKTCMFRAVSWISTFERSLWDSTSAKMSKLSFRARQLDANKALPVYRAGELQDLKDCRTINRAVPQMPTGMEKEEESVSSFEELCSFLCGWSTCNAHTNSVHPLRQECTRHSAKCLLTVALPRSRRFSS